MWWILTVKCLLVGPEYCRAGLSLVRLLIREKLQFLTWRMKEAPWGCRDNARSKKVAGCISG